MEFRDRGVVGQLPRWRRILQVPVWVEGTGFERNVVRRSFVKSIGLVLSLTTLLASTFAAPSAGYGKPLEIDEFDIVVKACADFNKIQDNGLLSAVHSIYDSDQDSKSTFKNLSQFLLKLPDARRPDGYQLYIKCISQMLPQISGVEEPQNIPNPSPLNQAVPSAVYNICSGEYERECQGHNFYLYCYSDVEAWARAHCTSYKITRLNTYGGNKCGYSLDSVFCTGPR